MAAPMTAQLSYTGQVLGPWQAKPLRLNPHQALKGFNYPITKVAVSSLVLGPYKYN
jgi:hypothetical protein